MSDHYDNRSYDRPSYRDDDNGYQQSDYYNSRRGRDRSRSRSPDDRIARERKARMARLRAENEKEERRLEVLDRKEEAQQEQLKAAEKAKSQIIKVDQAELDGMDEQEQMQRLLGFSGFGTTKGQEVEDNKTSAAKGTASKNKARKYRQYMNRKGGFNRPLDKIN